MSIKININNKSYDIPERLTVEQYAKAIQFDWADPKYYPKIMSELIGAPINELVQADTDATTLGMAFLVKAMNERVACDMLDLDQITFGQFVDLDVYLTMGIEQTFDKIVKVLTPNVKWANEAMWAIDKLIEFRTYTYRQYAALFGLDETIDAVIDDTVIDKYGQARAWYKVIVGLASNDLLKLDQVTDQPLIKVLNFMALQKEQQLEENQRKLQQKRQYDLQRTRR